MEKIFFFIYGFWRIQQFPCYWEVKNELTSQELQCIYSPQWKLLLHLPNYGCFFELGLRMAFLKFLRYHLRSLTAGTYRINVPKYFTCVTSMLKQLWSTDSYLNSLTHLSVLYTVPNWQHHNYVQGDSIRVEMLYCPWGVVVLNCFLLL